MRAMTDSPGYKKLFHFMRKKFLTGLFFLFPIVVTVWFLKILIGNTQRIARPFVVNAWRTATGGDISDHWLVPLISIILVVLVVLVVGWLTSFYLGKKFLNLVDMVLLKLPFIRSIYGGTKQIIDAFSMQRNGGSFKKVVLLEYPRRDCWVLGFVTNENLQRARQTLGRDLAGVFVPSTPNPTTGFLLYLPTDELFVLDLEVEEAVKLIVSAGLVLPETTKKQPKTLKEILEMEAGKQKPGPEPALVGDVDRLS